MKTNRNLVAVGMTLTALGLLVAAATWPAAKPAGMPMAPVGAEGMMPEEINKEELRAQLEREGKIIYLSGPRTMGKKLTIAGKEVQLPADAFVKDYIVDFDCAPSMPCAEEDQLPMLVIGRGNSELWISEPTGKVYLDRTDAAEPEAFRFMEEVELK